MSLKYFIASSALFFSLTAFAELIHIPELEKFPFPSVQCETTTLFETGESKETQQTFIGPHHFQNALFRLGLVKRYGSFKLPENMVINIKKTPYMHYKLDDEKTAEARTWISFYQKLGLNPEKLSFYPYESLLNEIRFVKKAGKEDLPKIKFAIDYSHKTPEILILEVLETEKNKPRLISQQRFPIGKDIALPIQKVFLNQKQAGVLKINCKTDHTQDTPSQTDTYPVPTFNQKPITDVQPVSMPAANTAR